MDKKDEDGARNEGSKGESRRGQGQTQTKHEWDDANDGDDRDRRWQMTMPTKAMHSQVVTSRGTEHSLSESATCHKIDRISSLLVCCAVAKSSVRDMERVKMIGR